MTVPTGLPGVLLSGTHASRPAANAVGGGALYAETDTGQIFQSDGASTWTAWGAAAALTFHGCKAYNSTTQGVNNTAAALTFDSEEFDSDGFHNTGSNTSRITIPSGLDGYYLFSGGTFASGGSDWIQFRVGGSVARGGQTTLAGGGVYRSASVMLHLVATNYVELWVSTTGNITFGHASAVDAQSWFACAFLGA